MIVRFTQKRLSHYIFFVYSSTLEKESLISNKFHHNAYIRDKLVSRKKNQISGKIKLYTIFLTNILFFDI